MKSSPYFGRVPLHLRPQVAYLAHRARKYCRVHCDRVTTIAPGAVYVARLASRAGLEAAHHMNFSLWPRPTPRAEKSWLWGCP